MNIISTERVLNTQIQPIEAYPVLFWITRKPSLNQVRQSIIWFMRYDSYSIKAFVELNTNQIYKN